METIEQVFRDLWRVGGEEFGEQPECRSANKGDTKKIHPHEDCSTANNKTRPLLWSQEIFADKKGQEGIAHTYNRQHQALLALVWRPILCRSVGKRSIKENRLLKFNEAVQKIGIVCAPAIHTIGRRKLVNKILKPDVPPPRDVEPLDGLGHGFIMIAVGICCFAAAAAIFLLIF